LYKDNKKKIKKKIKKVELNFFTNIYKYKSYDIAFVFYRLFLVKCERNFTLHIKKKKKTFYLLKKELYLYIEDV
jgi:hypothetical protein